MTLAVRVIGVPLMAAETVFVPPTVELKAPVVTPLALVVPEGCVSVLPVPVAARTTVAPWMGFKKASRAVTVIVDVPPLAAIEVGAALTVDCAALTAAAITVTAAFCVMLVKP